MISEVVRRGGVKKNKVKSEGKIEKSPALPKLFTPVVKYRNK